MREITITCPKCGAEHTVTDQQLHLWKGQNGICHNCRYSMKLPAPPPPVPPKQWLTEDQQMTIFWLGVSLPIAVAAAFFAYDLGVYQAVLNVLAGTFSGVRIELPDVDRRLWLLLPYRVLVSGWIYSDVMRRAPRKLPVWMGASILLPTPTLAVWLGVRPLLDGEKRRGGKMWSLLRGFVFAWSVLWATHIVALVVWIAWVAVPAYPDIPVGVGFGLYWLRLAVFTWFAPVMAALVFGQFVKDDESVDYG